MAAGEKQFHILSHPTDGASVTPHDSNDLSVGGILFVGVGGDVRVNTQQGSDLTFKNVPSGTFLPVIVSRVYSTNTTASNILVCYE